MATISGHAGGRRDGDGHAKRRSRCRSDRQTQLTATLKDAVGNALNGRTVTWTSSNTGVATVSATGTVTAVAAGTATITATSEGKSGTAAVTISNVAVGSVVVQPQNPTIAARQSVQLSATVRDVNGVVVTDRVVTWSTSSTTRGDRVGVRRRHRRRFRDR